MGVNTHCIGVRGNRLCLEAYARALREHPREDHRLRIEHAQIVRREDVALFAELGVIPAMQPTHCTSDMGFVEERIGTERAAGAYAWRWFLDAGLIIPAGSDFPVESNNPLLGIYAAVTRQDASGQPAGGWFPQQRMSRVEAVKAFTIWAAHGAFQEELIGSIEVGKLADFTVLDRDILEVPVEEIPQAKVLYTIVGGEIRYRADRANDLEPEFGDARSSRRQTTAGHSRVRRWPSRTRPALVPTGPLGPHASRGSSGR
jgi:predicted amidohydrolase YtcJ